MPALFRLLCILVFSCLTCPPLAAGQASPAMPGTGAAAAPASAASAVSAPVPAAYAIPAAIVLPPAPGPAAAMTGVPLAGAPAPLLFASRSIFVFRAPLAGYPPADRAAAAQHRLQTALAKGGPLQPAIRSIPEGAQVLLDGVQLFVVTPADVNLLAGDSADSAAALAAVQLGMALTEHKEQGSLRYLAIAGAFCLGATLAYALLLRALHRLHGWAARRSAVLLALRLRDVRLKNVRVLDAEHYVAFARHLLTALLLSLFVMATYLWLAFVLGRVPYTRAWGERLKDYLLDTAADVARAIAGAIPGLVLVVVIVAIARLVALTAASFFKRVESGELQIGWLDRDTALPTRRIVGVAIWLFALAMAYPYLPGSHTAAFQGLSVLLGLMVSLGASSIVGQAASGLILMYTRALRKGEYVKVGETEGTVLEVGMFETRLRTGLGEEVALPNAWVMGQATKNYSRAHTGTGFVLDTTVTIGYGTPWRQVHAMLELAAARVGDIAATPKPYVMQVALQDYYVEYRLVAYGKAEAPRKRVELLNQLHQQIIDVFNEFEVQIMSPHYIADTPEPMLVPREAWHRAPASRPPAGGGPAA